MKTWVEYYTENDGTVEGDVVYICDIQSSYNGIKLVRKESPKQAVICHEDSFPQDSKLLNKKNRFSPFFLLEVIDGVIIEKKPINIYDSQGNCIKIFNEFEECVNYFNSEIEKIEKYYNLKIENYKEALGKLTKLKVKPLSE